MIRPFEGGVSDLNFQVQGGAQSAEDFVPRRSERLKNMKPILPCVPQRQGSQAQGISPP